MTEPPDTTYELELRFTEAPEAAAATKRALLTDLARRGVTALAEGVIDGVDVAVDGTEAAGFGDAASDAAPILVFDYDEQVLAALETALVGFYGPRLATRLLPLATASWQQAWTEDFQALTTRRFFVHQAPPGGSRPDGLMSIALGAGTAFGDGRHATTQVALELLEDLPAGHPTDGFLDVGTGTGVLVLAAARLGFARLVGTEIDAEVLAEAAANAQLNGTDVVLRLTAEPPRHDPPYAVVAANILVPVLHQILPRLAAALAPGGSLLLAGFIAKEVPPLLAAAARHGLVLLDRRECRGWVGLRLGTESGG